MVLVGCPDGDTDPCRELVLVHRSHNHPSLKQFLEYLFPLADLDEHEICHARDKLQIALTELGLEKIPALSDHLSRLRLIRFIPHPGQSAGLRDRIDVERLPCLLQQPDQFFVR